MTIYIVKPGDSIDSIAALYGINSNTVIYNNQLVYPYRLAIGQALLLSTGESSANRRTIYSNGYAYPFINRYNLIQTLPYLSDLSVFSYGFTIDGMLIPPATDDAWMISLALEYNVSPILTLTPFGPDGQFNNYLIHILVTDSAVQKKLIGQLVTAVSAQNFMGVDIDFEFILPEDKYAFVEFIRNVRTAINPLGYPVSVALAPKTSDNQTGLLYEGKDYALIGEAADHVLLMTYEWGYT